MSTGCGPKKTPPPEKKPTIQSFGLYILFLWPHPQDMEVAEVGVESELQLLACATAMATLDPRYMCNLCHSLQQCRILNPLSNPRDGTYMLTETTH